MYVLIRILLALHITGLVVMAGTTMIDYLTFRTFWKLADQSDSRTLGMIPLMAKFGAYIRAGGAIILLTGITMLVLEKSVWVNQTWFKLKMVLVFLLLVNGLFVGNTQGEKFREAVSMHASDFVNHTVSIRQSLGWFYPIQLLLFFLIILISMIRFDK